MSEFDPQNPLKRPSTPVKTSWFEFLLNPSLLEEHLQTENAEPSATELIALFLQQSDVALSTAKEINRDGGLDSKMSDTQSEKGDLGENKKVQALKLLALKVASYLKWDLDMLEEGLPLAMVHQLLNELLTVAQPGMDPSPAHHPTMDLARCTPYALFAILLYHRWCLRTAVKDVFPVKQSKVASVQVPGLLDPSVQYASLKENILRMVKDNIEDSVKVCERYLAGRVSVCLPSLHCFQPITEDVAMVAHEWSLGTTVLADEVTCQVCYDLGCMYFHQQLYDKAGDAFGETKQLLTQMKDIVCCNVDTSRLDGYYCACCGILGRPPAGNGSQSEQSRLVDAIEATRTEHFEGVTTLLLQDNQKCRLSLSYRLALEEDVKQTTQSQSLYQEVVTCNVVRQALEGRITPVHYVHMVTREPHHIEFLLEVASSIVSNASFSQRHNLKYFIRYLCYSLPATLQFIAKVLSSELKPLFNPAELDALTEQAKHVPKDDKLVTTSRFPEPVEANLQWGDLERQLLVSYDLTDIRNTVQKLAGKFGKFQTMYLSDKWRIPKDLHQAIESLPVPQQSFTAFIHIIVAKARICVQLEMYDKAHELLLASETSTKDISYKLSRMLRWEHLKVDLLQHQNTESFSPGIVVQEVVKKAKNCITSLKVDHAEGPSQDVVSHAVAFLLNVKEWDHFSSLNSKGNGYVEFTQLICSLCKELPQMKNARKPARELWDAVILMFTTSTQQKRTVGGATTSVSRDANLGLISAHYFIKFLQKIKDPVILSAFISLLTKIYNNIKDDLTIEISSDYITLWPTSLGSTGSLNVDGVGEAMTTLLHHATTLCPTQPSWLHTQADIHFANGQHSQAMKYFLEMGVVMTDYFAKPVTKNVYDDNIYKRMMKCLNSLKCFTQVAVICQYLDEVDYSTAFKVLQEKNVHDAMDSLYDCLWDITILEFLINLHTKRGEADKRQHAMKLIGQQEINSSNSPEILFEAAKLRKAKFLRTLAKQYL